ncbi:uncharacterized protein LOC126769954 [Nymphalis io]|uniref:uncharacterized protein LOC126769954 n=1 Tax=Inachis io TaxID=171585 RepID=UPI00216A8057|nr:uncharacterized protein LOC126769954 [Nymphalis io]
MILRTPRRRISPRTKLRYRAIKNFLRRALGTSTQGDVLTSSSIGVSVVDFKNKIDQLEQQLISVSKHCQDIANLRDIVKKDTENVALQDKIEDSVEKKHKNVESKHLRHKLSRDNHNRDESQHVINVKSHDDKRDMILNTKSRKCCKSYETKDRHNNVKSKHNTTEAIYSTSSLHSLVVGPKHKDYVNSGYCTHRQKLHQKKAYIEALIQKESKDREIIKKKLTRKDVNNDRQHKPRRQKREITDVDENFIADIIEKQYKPVKLFGKRHSDFSQFSAPVCRDQELRIQKDFQEGSELCSCCFDENRRHRHRYVRNNDLSDMRSICDTRLYSSRGHRSYKNSRRCVDDYNNSAFYDIVPVKEKSSPKSRRKFADDNKMIYHCKEVPPSPRTQRPRLNLKIHNYTEYEDSLINVRNRSKKNPHHEICRENVDIYESDYLSGLQQAQKRRNESSINIKADKSKNIKSEMETMTSLQDHNITNEPTANSNNDTTLNTQVTDLSIDKTDKALDEIKNILQSFLLEIKKESTHDRKSNTTNKTNIEQQESNKVNANTIPNSRHSMNQNVGQYGIPPFLPTFPNPYCYPVFPLCPINCLQSGYMLPNPSFTCMACAKQSKENACPEKDNSNNTSDNKTSNETQELVKEIYKFVSQNQKSSRKCDDYIHKNKMNGNERCGFNTKIHTNRSVGSSKGFRHDANVGTPMKCYSKSCEAIGPRIPSEEYYTTNGSYSDTVLEKLSLEATESSSESDVSTEVPNKKGKRGAFKKAIRSLLFRKKKDVIEEESTVDVKSKPGPPFKQNITAYTMHDQQYFHPPPISKHHSCPPHPHEYCYNCDHKNIGNISQHPMRIEFIDKQRVHCDHMISSHRNPINYSPIPLCPNYDPHYKQQRAPQVPLCLKEVEVKSIGTQSVRKMSIFSKFTKKIQPPVNQNISQQNYSTPTRDKPSLWKSWQEKAKQQSTDPLAFSFKTQKQLEQGDMKIRNAMLKKLFYKKNPFSPRNLIIKTILGKDKSSFGNPPKMYKPRMFL